MGPIQRRAWTAGGVWPIRASGRTHRTQSDRLGDSHINGNKHLGNLVGSQLPSDVAVRDEDEDRVVHLRRACDHVLAVVGMARAADIGVVTGGRLTRSRDRNPARLLLGRGVDLTIGADLAQFLGGRRRQRRLPLIHMPDRARVPLRLRPLQICLCHSVDVLGTESEFRCASQTFGSSKAGAKTAGQRPDGPVTSPYPAQL